MKKEFIYKIFTCVSIQAFTEFKVYMKLELLLELVEKNNPLNCTISLLCSVQTKVGYGN